MPSAAQSAIRVAGRRSSQGDSFAPALALRFCSISLLFLFSLLFHISSAVFALSPRTHAAMVHCYSSLALIWRKVISCDFSCCSSLFSMCARKKELHARTIRLGHGPVLGKFPPNVVRNQKYNVFTFVPLVMLFISANF